MADLTQDEATDRAAAIEVDSYDIFLDLTAEPVFSRTEIRFRTSLEVYNTVWPHDAVTIDAVHSFRDSAQDSPERPSWLPTRNRADPPSRPHRWRTF